MSFCTQLSLSYQNQHNQRASPRVPEAVAFPPRRWHFGRHADRQRCHPLGMPLRHQLLHRCYASTFDQAWGPALDLNTLWDTLPQNLFAISLFPYLGFLYHLHRSKQTPPLTLFGFYFLLAFVFATIPAGIYAKKVYGQALANVDWLHGSAESLLTITNLMIVLGLRDGIREAEAINSAAVAVDEEQAAGAAAEADRAELLANDKQPVSPRE